MSLGMIIQNQKMMKMQNFAIWIQKSSQFMQKHNIFAKTLQKILKQGLTLQILTQTDHFLKEQIISGQIINHKWTNHKKKIVGLRAQTHSYLKDNNDKDKRQKALKKNEKKFEDERNCVEAVQVENKIDLQKKNKIGADGPKEDHKEFIKSNEFILKTRRRFKIEKHNIFIDEINKNALSSNNDERMQSIDLMETYAHGSSKDLVCKKENTKCSNIIKQYKNI